MKLKQYEVESRVEFFHEPIGDILRRYRTIKKYAYILHDKDSDTSPHYHIYLNFGNSGVDSKIVAQWFGLQESQVNKINGRATDMLLYLTHGNPSQKHKYQYSPSEVIANFDFEEEIRKSQIIGDFKKYSYAEQLQYINTLPVADKPAAHSKLEKLWKIHCQCMLLEPDRKIDVMFIYGKTGTGKTYYAKKFAKAKGYDVCVSSSMNDSFQDYLGQKCMILDDLRDTAFEFADLLKILDNNTNSSVKSRFSNKVFNGELIIITSSVPLSFWYRELQYNKNDSLMQLYRRITCYVEITPNFVQVYDGKGTYGESIPVLDTLGRPQGNFTVFKNELADKTYVKEKKTDFVNTFVNMLDQVPFDQR